MRCRGLIALLIWGQSVAAADLGTWGDLWPVKEPDMLTVIMQRLAGLVMTVLTVGLVSCAGKSLPRFWPGDFFPVFYACHLAVLGVLAL
ncbi:hypothetical protein A8528_004918 [Escherichia coli]|nr:hypothetical protein [Escherichia coli]